MMHQTMFPLLVVNVLENHATEKKPLTISEITKIINEEFQPFADKNQVINRSTVMRILDSMTLYTEIGNLLNFRVVECGSENKKRFHMERF